MRWRDVGDYRELRRISTNPGATLRFCKRTPPPGALQPVELKGRRRLLLRSDRADGHMFHRIFLKDEYRLRRLGGRGLGTVVDLGGNVGLFAARVAPAAERVICYEPSPDNYVWLALNLFGYANVECVQAAVADRRGTLKLFSPASDRLSGQYSLHADTGRGRMSAHYDQVESFTLADVFERHRVDRCGLLKIDVEGSEYGILYSAPAELLRRTDRIHAEYHDVSSADPRTRIASFSAFLASHGFAVEVVPHARKDNHGMIFATRARAGDPVPPPFKASAGEGDRR